MDIVDLTGKTFGWLTINRYIGKTGLYKCKKYGTERKYEQFR